MLALLTTALAAPPEGVDPDDLDRWAKGSARALAGPTGCWDLTGDLALVLAGYMPASRWTGAGRRDHRVTGEFQGRIQDGRWTAFTYTARSEGDTDFEVPLYPLVGVIDPDIVRRTDLEGDAEGDATSRVSIESGSDAALNTIQRVLDELDPDTATSYAEWSDELGAVKLYEDFPLSQKVRDLVTITTVFPAGGPATSLDVTFPRRVKVGEDLIKATLFDAQMHLRGQVVGEDTLPALESLSVGIGFLGFTVAYEQKLTYEKASRCEP